MKKMISTKRKLKLPEGNVEANVSIFTEEDKKIIKFIYESWLELSRSLKTLGSRGVNIPEGLSETAVCMFKSWYRVNNSSLGIAKTSFDAYDPKGETNTNRVQIKACSIDNDLTSFGPNSVWDRIFFADFYNDGQWNGKVVLYEINTQDIREHRVNLGQAFTDQQGEKRRPRFSIKKDLISQGKYLSKEEFNIYDVEIESIDDYESINA